jgi:RelA/SpoT family (p)ppGpp synthetase
VNSEKECYEVLGVIHHAFTPIPGRFKDYIAMPKSNLYQSLHTTVIGPYGRPLEVQIRTHDMHRIAEYGIAAHWKYKEAGGAVSAETLEDQKLSWLRQMVQMKEDTGDAQEYVDCVKLDLFQDEVFIFTPKGEVVDLPRGSTPIDFAYRIHTEVGNTCTGAIVNGKIVPLNHSLRNGDIVEIIRNKKSSPRLDWIKFVKTQQAKSRIRQWFKKNFKQEHELQGRQLLEAESSRAEIEEALKNGKLLEVAKELNYASVDDLLTAVGYGELNPPKVLNRLKKEDTLAKIGHPLPIHTAERITKARLPKPNASTEIEGLKGMVYTLAKCCTPVPGEHIVAVVTRSRGVMVHRDDCINLHNSNPERHMMVDWAGMGRESKSAHAVKLDIIAIDRLGVFKDILTQIADSHTNVSNAKVRLLPDQTAFIELSVDVHDLDHLERVKNAVRRVQDVISVKRQQTRNQKSNKPLHSLD